MLILALLLAASPALARTDLSGCTSSESVVVPTGGGTPYGTVIWYVPDTGELCEILDCGGGRAPPKTTVPGCDSYEGTETYSPKYLDIATSTAADDEAVISASASWSGDDDETLTTEAPTSQKTTKKETAKPEATTSASSEGNDDESSAANSTPASAPATTPAAGSGSGSNSTAKTTDAASSSTGGDSAETTSSTGGVASMPTAGALMGLVAGAAVYAGLL